MARISAVAALAALVATPALAQYDDERLTDLDARVADLAARFPAFAPLEWTERDDERAYVYGDANGIVHLNVTDGERMREVWRSFSLEGSIRHVFAEDLDRDGSPEIVAVTSGPRIYVWETQKHELLWESVDEKFESIQAVTVADVDRDDALEIVTVVDSKLTYYDGAEFFREKEGRDFIDPSAIVVGDVDGDLTPEIVTNDGYVIDTETLNIEWATDGFGYPIQLFDVDADGVPELVGENERGVTIWDVEERRNIW